MRRLVALVCLLATACGSSDGGGAGDIGTPLIESPPTPTPVTSTPDVGQPAPTSPDPSVTAAPDVAADGPARYVVEVIAQYPHDPGAYTQGLVLDGDTLLESTGRDTSLRRVDRTTGEVLEMVDVDDEYFGEGLELVGDRLIQLTWQNGVAFVYDSSSFEVIDQYTYDTEGWGLCQLDDGRLAMSDGSSRLTFRDPGTFAAVGSVEVALDGQPVPQLNELECVGTTVWANVYRTNFIVGIDAATGEVTAVVDAQALDDADPAADSGQVLNGIAHDSETDTFLLTGKEWSTMFEVRFVDAG